VIHCAPEDAPAVVNAMIEHEAVRKINFTGSTAVGRKIARACGANLKPCLMELGGKNSSIVCEDADLGVAVGGVLAGAFLNVSLPYLFRVVAFCGEILTLHCAVRSNLYGD
jgi:acyl-CoA reductase-like NAD-dependent aldehyde dehydrogenase